MRKAEQIAASIHNRFLTDAVAQNWQALKTRAAPSQPLSEREREVLRLICAGKSNQEIADELFIALDTVKRRAQAILEARRLGLV